MGNDTDSATIVTVNGTPYAAASMPTLTFTAGQSVTYAFATQVTSTLTGKRYALTTPAPAPSSPFTVSGNTTVAGTYKTQYRLMLATSPSGIGGATNPSANPSSTDGFYDSGTSVDVTALTPVAIDATSQYRFDHWSGDASGSIQPASVSMTAARAVTANYVTQYQVMFKQMGIGGDTGTAVVLTVGSTTFAAGDLPDTQYWDTGTTWTFGSPIATGSTDKRYRLTSTASGTITSAGTITGTYVAQYLLTLNISPSGVGGASNPSVSPSSTDGFYDDGDKVNVDAQALVTIDATSRYRFDHWSGGASGATKPVEVTMSAATTVTANYVTQYKLTLATSPSGTGGATNPSANPSNTDGFYDSGTSVDVTALTPVAIDATSQYRFDHWSGDASGSIQPASVSMTAARAVTANYVTQYQVMFKQMGIGGDTGTAVVLTVGSTTFAAGDLPDTQYWDTGTTWTFGSPIATGSTDKRYRLTSTASGTITSAGTITGSYVAQYLLTLAITTGVPNGLTNITGGSTGTFYDAGTPLTLATTALVADGADKQWLFTNWTGDVPRRRTATLR